LRRAPVSPTARSRARRRSAGLILYRTPARKSTVLEVLLVHPGGPLWANKDVGAWSIPKGEYDDGEDPLAAALREFSEELGSPPPAQDGVEPIDLGEIRQKSGKRVSAWALAGDFDVSRVASNTFTMEWPPRSGRANEFPEVDRAEWFRIAEARRRINPAQAELLDRLVQALTG
jgi:predicted NUDIX family NTP pyrophosphohydrolase